MRITSSTTPPKPPAGASVQRNISPAMTPVPPAAAAIARNISAPPLSRTPHPAPQHAQGFPPPQPARHAAIDILRGLCLVGMIFALFPHPDAMSFPWLQLDRWTGCYATELIFALFLFLSGASLSCALAHRAMRTPWQRLQYILLRVVFLFILGLLINTLTTLFPSSGEMSPMLESVSARWNAVPIYGLLQRLALCTLLSALLVLLLRLNVIIALAAAGLLVLHGWILIHAADSPESIALAYTLDAQIASRIDLYLIGAARLTPQYEGVFDPYGLLGVLSGSATLLFGYLTSSILRQGRDIDTQLRVLSVLCILCIVAALFLSRDVPISRPLWTSSYVLLTAGLSMGLLGICTHASRFPIIMTLSTPARIMGENPLAAYLSALLLSYALGLNITRFGDEAGWTLQNWLFDNMYHIFDFLPQAQLLLTTIAYSLIFTCVVLLPCIILLKMKIHFTARIKA